MKSTSNVIRITDSRPVLFPVFIDEGRYYVKNITCKLEKINAHRLRHSVFCRELGWVPGSSDSLEIDEYDENAVFIGVYDVNHDLKAFLRIVLPEHTFMLEKEFPFLMNRDYLIRKENDTIEISRLCVEHTARNRKIAGNFGVYFVSMMLYKGVYNWCLNNEIRYIYMAVEEKIGRMLCSMGFPCRFTGEPTVMPDGVIAVAARLDWREFEEKGVEAHPNLLAWFRQSQLSLPIKQLRQRGTCLPHQVLT